MRAILPLDAPDVDESQVRLVGERRGLESVARTLAAHVTAGQPAQFGIDERREPIERAFIPLAPGQEQVGDLRRRGSWHRAPCRCDADSTPLPLVHARDKELTFAEWRMGAPLIAGAFGILQPRSEAMPLEPDIVLVPLAAFDRLDRIGIFLLIAGTYTPLAWGLLRGRWRWGTLASVWLLAAGATVLLALGLPFSTPLATGLYLGMGWGSIVCYAELARAVSHSELRLLVIGEACEVRVVLGVDRRAA